MSDSGKEICGAPTKTTGRPCQNPARRCPHHRNDQAGLTDKQRRFVEEYTVDFNGSAAARRAGYSPDTAASIAHENLSKPDIKSAIKERLDRLAMSADEALKRLADWGRGTPEPFLRNTATGEVMLDLSTAEARANLHLIRKIKVKETRKGDDVVDVRTEVELHDAKDAVKQIARAHGVFVDKVEHSGEVKGGGDVHVYLPDNGRDKLPQAIKERMAPSTNGHSNGTSGDGS